MGEGITVRCSKCGYKGHFTLGIGMLECSLENIVNELPYQIKSKVEGLMKEHKIDRYYFNRELTQCEKCRGLDSHKVISVSYDSDKTFETNISCDKCKGKLKVIKDYEKIKELPCPECGEKSLDYSVDILWD